MKRIFYAKYFTDERGMALVTAMLILLALTVLSVTAMTNTSINTRIAGNDFHTQRGEQAAESCAQVATATLQAIIEDDIKLSDGTTENVSDIDGLLAYNYDPDNEEANVTPLVDAVLDEAMSSTLNEICNKNPEETYSVIIRDNDKDYHNKINTAEDNDPLVDKDEGFYLKTQMTKQKHDGSYITKDMVELKLKAVLSSIKGAVNLINADENGDLTYAKTEVVFGNDKGNGWAGKITGDHDDDVSAIVTTDNNPESVPEEYVDQVVPDGVKVVEQNKYDEGTIDDIQDYIDKIKPAEPDAEGNKVRISNSENNDILGTPGHPKVTYVKGRVEMKGTIQGAGILIIEEHYNTKKDRYEIGFKMEDATQFDGMVFLVPRSADFNEKIRVKLEDASKLNGAIVAASKYMAFVKEGEEAIRFNIKDTAECNFKKWNDEDNSFIHTSSFTIKDWNYLY